MAQGLAAAALLLAVVLGGDFGVATASGEPAVGNRILVTLEVEVLTSADAVVAHLIQPGQDQETISLSGDESGIYRGAATVPKADIVVVFEAVRGPANSSMSAPAFLTELGLDRALLGDLVIPIEESVPTESTADVGLPLTIAIVSGVLSLGLIVWWVWSGAGNRDEPDVQVVVPSDSSDGVGSESADSPEGSSADG